MRSPSKHTALLILAFALAALFGTACRTVQGFGQDVEKTGENIEEAAR